ncbi:MAG: hypothetical protein AAF630_12675 [Cyanobacteria bacterium P01_C01_bin.38]
MTQKCHVPFWRAVGKVTSSLTLIIERWFEGIYIPIRSDQTVSSTEIACGVDKPFNRQIEATLKQEVNTKTNYVQLCLDLGSFG